MITLDEFKKIMPRMIKNPNDAAKYLPLLNDAMEKAEINTKLRMAAFLAQIGHESYEFKYVKEIWGPTPQQLKYEPPSKLATMLGNDKPGDGLAFSGKGWIQITGRSNFRTCGKALGLDLENNPKLAEDPKVGFQIATWFWTSRNLNELADKSDFETITKKINGGLNGYEDRVKRYKLALSVLK